MKVREAYEMIGMLKVIKNGLQAKHSDKQLVNNMDLYRKIRRYNREIENLEQAIMDMEFDDSYEFDYDLYYVKDDK